MGTTVAKMRKTAGKAAPQYDCLVRTDLAFVAERRYSHCSADLSQSMMKAAEEFPPNASFGALLISWAVVPANSIMMLFIEQDVLFNRRLKPSKRFLMPNTAWCVRRLYLSESVVLVLAS